ncbi:hypothetical protein ACJIZ3_007917 [Penstemon smallii]|uniref:Uncharacterized protein n=1 Tax=Penstemon smallii TaxID=265156 RepID=A0ABD3T8A2_9LAMI
MSSFSNLSKKKVIFFLILRFVAHLHHIFLFNLLSF